MKLAGKILLVVGIVIYIAAIFATFGTPAVDTEEGVKEAVRASWGILLPFGIFGTFLTVLGVYFIFLANRHRGQNRPRENTKPAS